MTIAAETIFSNFLAFHFDRPALGCSVFFSEWWKKLEGWKKRRRISIYSLTTLQNAKYQNKLFTIHLAPRRKKYSPAGLLCNLSCLISLLICSKNIHEKGLNSYSFQTNLSRVDLNYLQRQHLNSPEYAFPLNCTSDCLSVCLPSHCLNLSRGEVNLIEFDHMHALEIRT